LRKQVSIIAEVKEVIEISSMAGARITILGKFGDDVKPYQEREAKQKIKEATQ